MEIKAKCRFDQETIKAMARVSVYKKSEPQKRMIVEIIIAVLIILLSFADLIAFGFNSSLIITIIVAILLICWVCFLYFCLPKKQYKAMAKMREAENEYVFYDNEVEVFTSSAEYNGSAKIEYSLFVKVYETSSYFFLYQTKNQVFVVDKSTIDDSNIKDIRTALAGAINGKYIICKY